MLHYILYVTRDRTHVSVQEFDKAVDYMFNKMESGAFTFDIQYIEDNAAVLTTLGATNLDVPILKDAADTLYEGTDAIREIIDAVTNYED